jgi:hypothetical protein
LIIYPQCKNIVIGLKNSAIKKFWPHPLVDCYKAANERN